MKSTHLLSLSFAGLLTLASAAAHAAPDSLSVHVLNQNTGQPAAGVPVNLEQKMEHGWRDLGAGVTDKDGRIKALFPVGQPFVAGEYRVIFHTRAFYAKAKESTFFPEVIVPFEVQDPKQHYHVPLLLSRYSYTVYRGQ